MEFPSGCGNSAPERWRKPSASVGEECPDLIGTTVSLISEYVDMKGSDTWIIVLTGGASAKRI